MHFDPSLAPLALQRAPLTNSLALQAVFRVARSGLWRLGARFVEGIREPACVARVPCEGRNASGQLGTLPPTLALRPLADARDFNAPR